MGNASSLSVPLDTDNPEVLRTYLIRLTSRLDEVADSNNRAQPAFGDYKFIGETFYLVAGAPPPSNSGSAKFVRLTYGQSGDGDYNSGLLKNEDKSGDAPLLQATAEISVGPMAGKTINLWNTENRYPKPGETPGELGNDQIQSHVHSRISGGTTGWIIRNGSDRYTPGSGNSNESDAAWRSNNPSDQGLTDLNGDETIRSGDYTDVKHEQVTAYMRIL